MKSDEKQCRRSGTQPGLIGAPFLWPNLWDLWKNGDFGPFWDKLEVTSAVLASATWPSVARIKSTTYVEEVGRNLA